MKTCILILCSPRSGSSCLAGCVNLCGASLGKNVTQVKDKHNSKGYFENQKLLRTHQNIINNNNIPMFASDIPTQVDSQETRELLCKVFENQFEGDELFAIKDPRILFMKPTYLGALSDYGANVKVLALRRKPEHSAASIDAGPWAKNKGLASHSRYTQLLNEFGVEPKLEVQFEDLISNPKGTMQKVCEFMGTQYNPEVESFVDKGMVHQK